MKGTLTLLKRFNSIEEIGNNDYKLTDVGNISREL